MPEILQYSFFQNALLSSILVGVLGGFIGTYIVTRRLVFIAGGLAHASLGGVGICVLLGISPLAGAAGFTLLSALGMDKLRRRLSVREDAAVAMLWAFGMSLGVMCVFLSPSFLPDLPNYIFGNILLSTSEDLIFLTVVTALTVLFFFRFMRPLLEQGHVYIAQPPLFKLQKGNTVKYAYNDEEMKILSAQMPGAKVNRYKGLGEMNPDQLWETTMNPANRVIVQIKIEDAERADEAFSILMGEQVEPRKQFIEKNAKYANLDV